MISYSIRAANVSKLIKMLDSKLKVSYQNLLTSSYLRLKDLNLFAGFKLLLILQDLKTLNALVAELVDALDSKSSFFGSAGSIPAQGTSNLLRNGKVFYI